MNQKIYHEEETDSSFYYFVLNLSKSASSAEINERHRSLSLVFHPDKQRDDESKEAATKKFLEIQKAYQVLSDPFSRVVYDILGERGLSVRWSPDFRTKSPEDIRRILLQTRDEMDFEEFKGKVAFRGMTTCLVDASSLFNSYSGCSRDAIGRGLRSVKEIGLLSFSTKLTTKKRLNDRTTVGFKTRMGQLPGGFGSSLIGTLRHQFSPRLTTEADYGFLWPHFFRLKSVYNENGSSLVVTISSLLGAPSHLPTVTIFTSRRLFRRRFEVASFELATGPHPRFVLNLVSPTVFGAQSLDPSEEPARQVTTPSLSGLEVGINHRKLGLIFESIFPAFVAEWGVNFTELALQLRFAIQYGMTGISLTWAGTWSNSNSSVTLSSHLYPTGLSLRIDLDHLHQQIALPIFICAQPRLDIAFWITLLPSSALILGYHWIIKPRRRRQRLEHIRTARKILQEDMDGRSERQALVSLLGDSARKSKTVEASSGGLIITEATYGPQSKEDSASDLTIDVSIPLQALVRTSQLNISADHPRWKIPGFTDPAPSVAKMLSIRYLFAGRAHFAEVHDKLPIVLPLAEHLVE